MENTSGALIDEWPKISFAEIEDLEIEGDRLSLFYHTFFHVLHFPEKICSSFITLFKGEPETVST